MNNEKLCTYTLRLRMVSRLGFTELRLHWLDEICSRQEKRHSFYTKTAFDRFAR